MANAPKEVVQLVEQFGRNVEEYRRGRYNETMVRREYIDPMFAALGWDVDNRAGYAEAYKDVVHEDQIKVGAPDYCFRVGGSRKFFLEAKKPSVDIGADIDPAYQLRRYAWSAKLPLSVLTDFEEFAVYDCRIRPKPADRASVARINYIKYGDYIDRWDEIASVFSREAVLQGSFDKYVISTKKRGTAEVDAEFLKEIEKWRDTLARNLALRNPGLSNRGLNFAVQKTIDRLIFLRICEDRGIEPMSQLQGMVNGPEIYGRLLELFRRADDKYNSGLFHFNSETGREAPDELTPSLAIDDKVLKDIIKSLYYPQSPYEFSVLPADILGSVYEQFLGKVIHLTAGHRAAVEEKPEVKKAGGVYYTPKYIVDYIVEQTVGKLIDGKTPRQIAKLRVLDPACGSGSFLIGAYRKLLNYHRDWYAAADNGGPQKHTKEIHQGSAGQWLLATEEKKRILLNNIYGVDIDSQAVEVTKLNLLLCVLEGESEQTIGQMMLIHSRALPDLANNIKCGNSLIGSDYFAGKLIADPEEYARVNPFDWVSAFPEVFKGKNAGFDAVIGNPPYVRIQTMKEFAPLEVEIFKELFKSAREGNYDIYVVFIEQGLKLLNSNGRLGYICPHKFFNARYGAPIRSLVADGRHLSHVVHFGDQQVFYGATTYTCLLFLDKSPAKDCHFVKVDDLISWRATGDGTEGIIKTEQITGSEWNFAVGPGAALFEKLAKMPVKLGDVSHIFVGLQTDADDVFIVDEIKQNGNRVLCWSKATQKEHWFENNHLKPFLKGSLNVRRYYLSDVTKRLIFPYENHGEKSLLISPKEYKHQHPLTWDYLESNRERLAKRNKGKMGSEWYGYVYKKNHTRFGLPKIVVPSLASGSCFAADLDGRYFFVGSGGGGGGGYGIVLNEDSYLSPLYLLGVLNSNLLSVLIKANSTPFRGGYLALNRQYIENLPIKIIDTANKTDKAAHDRMVSLVESMLDLHKRLAAADTPHEKELIQRQIAATDKQIDKLVYDLYGLTEEEIRIVEEAV